jgi:hypothetical protein
MVMPFYRLRTACQEFTLNRSGALPSVKLTVMYQYGDY